MHPRTDGGRLLVVDDEPMMLELLTTRLTLAGYKVLRARSGSEAIATATHERLNGMLLDINMPGLDGFGVLEALGRHGVLKTLPVMVLTARNQGDDVRRAISLGARDFLTKPFKDQQLLTRVARLTAPPRHIPKPPEDPDNTVRI